MQSTIAPPEGPPRRRSPFRRRPLSLLLVLALMGAGAYSGWFLTNYDPLCHAGCAVGGVTGGHFVLGSSSSVRVQWRRGATFIVWFSLETSGPVGITVREVGQQPSDLAPIRLVRVQMASALQRDAFGNRRPFHPFALTQHKIVGAFLTYRMVGCVEAGTSYSLIEEPVRFSLFGIPRHMAVKLPVIAEIVGNAATCPG